MSPDFICVYSQATREEVLDRIRRSTGSADSITWVYVMNQRRRLKGAIQVVDVLRAGSGAAVGDIARFPKHVRPDADLEEVARLMTDYDLTVVPVVDADEQLLGVVTVDDVLELVLPRGWRRNFRVFGDD
jgi:Mg/Co/Ni transporter MgtE